MIENRSAPPGDVVPKLIYADVAHAVDWLCNAFGFTLRLSVRDGGGAIGHAQLHVGSGAVMLGPARTGQGFTSPDHAVLAPPRTGEVSHFVHVRVENVDRHFEQAKRAGARILNPPEDYPFGERQYTAEDFAGHRWTFSQSIADITPEAWGATRGKDG